MEAFDIRIKKLKSYHAFVLATWAAFNIISGSIMLAVLSVDTYYYFFLMNLCWGIVNAFISAFIFYHHNSDLRGPQTLLQQMDHQRHAEKVILFNVGLDIAYMACGVALYLNGNLSFSYSELWQGFGISVSLQGIYLLIQDYIFYQLHVKNRKATHPLWQKLTNNL